MVEGGDFGGEYSGRSIHSPITATGGVSSKTVSKITVCTTAWTVTVFVSSALTWVLCGVF
jgi:hypothetical protein